MLTKRQLIVNISIISMIVVNILATTLPIGGVTTAEVSNRYFNYFVPAGYIFSIWGLIYIGLIAFGVFQSLKQNRNNEMINNISLYVIINAFANAAWIFTWHFEILWLSVLLMIVILFTLLKIFMIVVVENRKVLSNKMNWFVRYPFTLYLGWISVATIANIAALLTSLNWSGFGISPIVWSVIMIVVASLIAIYLLLNYREFVFSFVIIWAILGIFNNQEPELIKGAVIALVSVITLMVVFVKYRLYK